MSTYMQFKKSVSKTAAYALKNNDHDIAFDNVGAGAGVTFTLPPIADVWDGWSALFMAVADFAITVTAPAGKLVAFNNAACASIAFSTAGEIIGSGVAIRYSSTAAKYIAMPILGSETATPTIS